MANTALGHGALAVALPLLELAEVSFIDHSSQILVSSPSRRRRCRTTVYVVVTDRSKYRAATRSRSLWIKRGHNGLRQRGSTITKVVEDALACLGNRGRQFLLDELVLVVVTLAC